MKILIWVAQPSIWVKIVIIIVLLSLCLLWNNFLQFYYSEPSKSKAVKVLPIGSKIYCWHCGKLLYITVAEVKTGGVRDAAAFKPALPHIPIPVNRERMTCCYCGGFFVENGFFGARMKTDKGVFPDDFKTLQK